MAYIGHSASGNFTTKPSKDTFSGDGSTTAFTLSEGATTNTVDVFVENVRQEPTTAYTVDGTTLTFTAAPGSGTNNIYVVNRGPLQLSATHPAAQALEASTGTFTGDLTIETTNKLGGTFTGTTDGEGLRVTQTDYTSGNYVSLIEAPFDDSQTAANVRIAAMFNSSGSNLAFGTSNSYGSGITNTAMFIDRSGNVGIGTATPVHELTIQTSDATPTVRIHADTDSSPVPALEFMRGANDTFGADIYTDYRLSVDGGELKFEQASSGTTSEVMRLDASGRFLFGKSSSSASTAGLEMQPVTSSSSSVWMTKNTAANSVLFMNRTSTAGDGTMVFFAQAGTVEGSISVSGTTVSYNGGHLSRWSQLTDGTKDTSIVKGTVMTNLDKMVVWSHDAVGATYYVDGDDLPEVTPATYYTEDDTLPDGVYVGDEKTAAVFAQVGDEKTPAKDAYTEDNEQLNCMAVSSVEGDPNVAGVFVNWDNDDDGFNDMNVAMTGDMVIRIAQGTTVARGDLLMSAGDGTAKPQGDDIVRSKTIAKVTSTQVSHTYDDGTYLVPCVLMAC